MPKLVTPWKIDELWENLHISMICKWTGIINNSWKWSCYLFVTFWGKAMAVLIQFLHLLSPIRRIWSFQGIVGCVKSKNTHAICIKIINKLIAFNLINSRWNTLCHSENYNKSISMLRIQIGCYLFYLIFHDKFYYRNTKMGRLNFDHCLSNCNDFFLQWLERVFIWRTSFILLHKSVKYHKINIITTYHYDE